MPEKQSMKYSKPPEKRLPKTKGADGKVKKPTTFAKPPKP
jgi:hypothetical protein